MKKKIFPLLLGGFGLGVAEFVMMGILPQIATAVDISISQAGYLISAYALGVVLGVPILNNISKKYSAKKALVILLLMFIVFNALTIVAPNFDLLVFSRLLAGLPHGAFFGVGSVVASRVAQKGKEAQAVSFMFMGLTLANVIGVPIGTYIGQEVSWRGSFMLIALIGCISLILLKISLPDTHSDTKEKEDSPSLLKFFNSRKAWIIVLMICIGQGGFFTWFSYVSPLLTNVSGFDESSVVYILIFAGVGMTAGSYFGGLLCDRYTPERTVMGLFVLMSISLLLVHFFSWYKIPSLILTFVTGATSFALVPSIQMLIIRSWKGSEVVASSVGQACFNVGNALGAWLGGIPLEYGMNYTWSSSVGVIMATFGILMAYIIFKNSKSESLGSHTYS
ncbi:hypothetical protein B0A69_02795 [Chryseobacterium shigense]|uniref:MFS transporter, DHA1 family, arabinose polymer transporter n=1 Tax=Chryseobacterium shigense TaxID=297244 RepID=A0A1N7I8D3_9FLAO|nr:MFS transporter [Chryseobacterium shigense]PQA96992.1 hypothetical protein B0A69_02795 [Chryseobacterium shigense]SIS33282.1 MFS transporter, DHA1 family, arabinose polymer transporter [Chryseobacterium shigense]